MQKYGQHCHLAAIKRNGSHFFGWNQHVTVVVIQATTTWRMLSSLVGPYTVFCGWPKVAVVVGGGGVLTKMTSKTAVEAVRWIVLIGRIKCTRSQGYRIIAQGLTDLLVTWLTGHGVPLYELFPPRKPRPHINHMTWMRQDGSMEEITKKPNSNRLSWFWMETRRLSTWDWHTALLNSWRQQRYVSVCPRKGQK